MISVYTVTQLGIRTQSRCGSSDVVAALRWFQCFILIVFIFSSSRLSVVGVAFISEPTDGFLSNFSYYFPWAISSNLFSSV